MRDIILEKIQLPVAAAAELLGFQIHGALMIAQRAKLTVAIMNDPHRRRESQLDRAPSDGERVLRIVNPAADHRVNIHVKLGMIREKLELLVEDFQALLRHLVRHHVVDADLHVLEPGAIQALDPLGNQQIPVCNHPGNDSMLANARDDLIEFRMQQRLAATDGHD